MKRFTVGKIIGFIVLIALAIAAMGLVVMGLWNWLMPSIFGLRTIVFCEAIGLLVLSKILFGGMRCGWGGKRHCHGGQCSPSHKDRWREKMQARMAGMSEEEREKFKKKLSRCGYVIEDNPTTSEEK
jgi:hypothetical protein